ncbi:hypothetical protein TRFO_22601 [Tritrichomonas foetus]|uniref:LIM zinc-binding domain-containing protein n=1 Tax=Tritrichomonas foetus TaxID=1144522 RepID=A0A1J4KGI6_9EUKA|nr:hypothetical protein TRFO_22601 [Tritrichomonas foetus]|eukprot:OHT08774.1 hypothetical protein TRFO_22601 [Tritrichomonas foetus]
MSQKCVDPYALPDYNEMSSPLRNETNVVFQQDDIEISMNNSNLEKGKILPSQSHHLIETLKNYIPSSAKERRVSFNTDTIFEQYSNMNIMPSELDNPLPSGTFPDFSNTIDVSDNNKDVFLMKDSISPTDLDSLPDYVVPDNLALHFEDPTILPDLPRLPTFNFDPGNMNIPSSLMTRYSKTGINSKRNVNNQNNDNNNNSQNRNSQIRELNSVTDLLLSDGFDNQMNLPQIPSTTSIGPMIAPESVSGSNGSSGNLPKVIQTIDDSEVNADGLPIRNCSICDRPVEFDGLFANGLYFHKTCANCFNCSTHIQPPKVIIFKEKLYCMDCSKSRNNINICKICNLPLDGLIKEIKINEFTQTKIHSYCLSCYECSRSLGKGQEEIINDTIFCKRCAQVIKNRKCVKCQEIIVGEFIKKHKKYYHPDHFSCINCTKLLYGNNYIIHHNKILCSSCGLYYMQHCQQCKQALYLTDEPLLKWRGKLYHKACFTCRVCGCDLLHDKAISFHRRPHCESCFNQRTFEFSISTSKMNHHLHSIKNMIERRKKLEYEGVKIFYPEYSDQRDRFIEEIVDTDAESSENDSKLFPFETLKLEK